MGRKQTTKEYVEKCKLKYGDKYSYEKTKYVDKYTEVIITCSIHGDFKVIPAEFVRKTKNIECPKCRKYETSINKFKYNIRIKEFIHKYEYDFNSYVDTKTKMNIKCKIHGWFQQEPGEHLRSVVGCPFCGRMKNKDEVINQLQSVLSDDIFIFTDTYTKASNKMLFMCKKHGFFTRKPVYVTSKNLGCNICSRLQSKKENPTILYYVKITNKELGIFFKIGVTSKTIKERFIDATRNGNIVELLDSQKFENEKQAYEKEQCILVKYHKYRCKNTNILSKHSGGNTELFYVDILKNKKLKDIECNFIPK